MRVPRNAMDKSAETSFRYPADAAGYIPVSFPAKPCLPTRDNQKSRFALSLIVSIVQCESLAQEQVHA